MERKKSFKILSLITAVFLLCLFMINGGNAHAEDGRQGVSGNDAPEMVCTCREKCGADEYDRGCAVCAADYKACRYKKPNVVIYINKPENWSSDNATVTFRVSDTAKTGNFELVKLSAKIGQNGSWMDITEDKKLEISENCTVYAQAEDQNGNLYEKSRAVRCFDNTKPTLNAAVSDGLLNIQVHDTESGVKTVYVNGYEFKDLTNSTLNIRLQQFDTGYEYFTVTALDHAGNTSEVYKIKNPYYKSSAEENGEDSGGQLPKSAETTKPGSAATAVTEHTKTDSVGNTISQTGTGGQEETESNDMGQGKEFYTIRTDSEKVFYLIIDRDGEEETVYFLTEITENDLLNTTSNNSQTLPKNSAALESAIPATESALSNNNTDVEESGDETETEKDTGEEREPASESEEPATEPEENPHPVASYIILGVLATTAVIGGYYFKVVRRKKEDFLDEDEEEEEEYEEEYPEDEAASKEEEYDEFFEELEE